MFKVEPFTGLNIWTKFLKDFPEEEIVKITPKESTKIGNIEIKPQSHVLTKQQIKMVEKLQNFIVREDDVWITTFPKCGTTWMQEMCWLIVNNYDFDTAKKTDLEIRSPYLEYNTFAPPHLFNSLEILEKSKSQRVIKTHYPICLLPKDLWAKNAKIIHVVRDPRDAAVSQYRMFLEQGLAGDNIGEFLNAYIQGCVGFSNGSFWTHTLDFWKLRHNSNYLFVTFEEMKEDLQSVIKRVCAFLNKPITEEQMTKMLEHLSFESMKNNETLNHNIENGILASILNLKMDGYRFMGKGIVGSHKIKFPPGFSEIFNEWVCDNLKDSDFPLYLKT